MRLPCPVCKKEFDDWDTYFEHLVEEKRKILNKVLNRDVPEHPPASMDRPYDEK